MSAIAHRPDFAPKPSETGRNVKEPRAARKPADAKVAPPRRTAGCRLALYQPDIAANAGAALRLAACLAVPLLVIEPCGFVWDDRRLRRAGLDYLAQAALTRLPGWAAFEAWRRAERQAPGPADHRAAAQDYHAVAYRPGDVLLAGRESAGVPPAVHAARRSAGPRADGAGAARVERGHRARHGARRGAAPDRRLSARERSCDGSSDQLADLRAPQPGAWFEALRDRICQAFEALEERYAGAGSRAARRPAASSARPWAREGGGGGVMR